MALNEHDPGGPERDARLDRLYAHAGHEEPPAHLDAAIRAAARRAVGAGPRAPGAWLRRWGVPISIAAVVVVSVSLVTVMREQGAGPIEQPYSPAPAEPKAAATAEPESAELKAQDRAQPAGRFEVAPQAPPAPAELARAPSATDDSARARGYAAPAGVRTMPAEEAGSAAPGAPGEVERAGAQQAAPGRDVPGKKKTEARAANGPTEPPAALRSAPLRADQAPLGALTRERSERQLTDNRLDLLLKELDKAQPQSWLETIERLRREGRHADADALADEFKRRFPGHPLTRQEDERAR